jgi:hypothetical protein
MGGSAAAPRYTSKIEQDGRLAKCPKPRGSGSRESNPHYQLGNRSDSFGSGVITDGLVVANGLE